MKDIKPGLQDENLVTGGDVWQERDWFVNTTQFIFYLFNKI